MSSSINKNVNVERRTWDKETYEARARSRQAVENGGAPTAVGAVANDTNNTGDAVAAIKNDIDPTDEKEEFAPAQQGRAGPEGSKRAFLKSRTNKVDLESKLGSTEIIDPAAASATKSNLDTTTAALTPSSGVSKCSDGVGWHCRVCDCFLKDSLTYLDHINGKKHQRYLGYTMRVEKSTTEEVSGILSSLGEKKRERENAILGGGGAAASSETVDFEDVVRKKDEEALRRKAERARRREERKRMEREEVNGSAAVQLTHTVRDNNIATEEEREDAEVQVGDNNPAEDEEGDDEEEEAVIDPALAAMMGISGFGSSKK